MTNHDNLPHDDQSITNLFHRVERIIQKQSAPVKVNPNTPVSEAVALMTQHNYSQLPVVAGKKVLGVFSFRSLTTHLLEMGQMREYFADLPVIEFMEDFQFVQPSDNWESLLDYLDRDDGVLVGQRENLSGIATAMDLLRYLHNQASPFVVLREIELSLRRVINACVSEAELQVCIKNSLKGKYSEDAVPSDLSEMTFNDYIQILGDGRNWPYFEVVFGARAWHRKDTSDRLKEVRDLRNDIFHFRRPITDDDYEVLKKHRRWLQTKAQAYESDIRPPAAIIEPEPVPPPAAPLTTRQKWNEIQTGGSTAASDGLVNQPDRYVSRKEFWTQLLDRARPKTSLHSRLSPSKESGLGTSIGKSGFNLMYHIHEHNSDVELVIYTPDSDRNKECFLKLQENRNEIEAAFGGSLSWDCPENRRGCYIRYEMPGGGRLDAARWSEIQDKMIDAMIRLEQALKPYIARL